MLIVNKTAWYSIIMQIYKILVIFLIFYCVNGNICIILGRKWYDIQNMGISVNRNPVLNAFIVKNDVHHNFIVYDMKKIHFYFFKTFYICNFMVSFPYHTILPKSSPYTKQFQNFKILYNVLTVYKSSFV